MRISSALRFTAAVALAVCAAPSLAAQYEMGTGVPTFGIYTAATGVEIRVWSLASPSIPFPAGCTSLTITPATMGMDSYKVAAATLLLAKATNRQVRFYAHATRDSGCGVDYIELG